MTIFEKLRAENERLKNRYEEVLKPAQALRAEVARLKADNEHLIAEANEAHGIIDVLSGQIKQLGHFPIFSPPMGACAARNTCERSCGCLDSICCSHWSHWRDCFGWGDDRARAKRLPGLRLARAPGGRVLPGLRRWLYGGHAQGQAGLQAQAFSDRAGSAVCAVSRRRDTILKPGDIIRWDDRISEPHLWRVRGVHLGAEGQESLIELENVSHQPGWTGHWETHLMMFVPECLLRDCQVIPVISGEE